MAEYTITTSPARDQAIAAAAATRNQTKAEYVQDRVDREADAALAATYEQWFAGLSIAQKQGIYDANQ